MTELEISIGGRTFSVACDNEEQDKVKQAASIINEEADAIQSQLGRLPESKMLLLSALMIADRLADLDSESKTLNEKSEEHSNLKNMNKQLEQQKNSLEIDCQNLEKLVEKMLVRLEKVSSLCDKNSDKVLSDESSKNIIEADQPKLF